MRSLDSIGLVDTERIHPEISIVILVLQPAESRPQVGRNVSSLSINGDGAAVQYDGQ